MSAALDRLGEVNTNTVLSMDTYWKNAMSVCEAAMSMLAPFENQNHTLVDAATTSLRQLLTHGKEYSRMKQYSAATQRDKEYQTASSYKHRPRKTIQDLGFNPRENWIIKDERTVLVRLPDDTHVTCQAITTVEELDAILPELRKASHIAIDCEFLGLKGCTPELKVLQLAVSSTLGYALTIDRIGLQAVRERLEPILSQPQHQQGENGLSAAIANQERLYLGWAFRGDAQAIEAAFPGIQLPYILDLQAKLRSVAVEQLKLFNAMNRYAPNWSGLEEFNKAKQLGDTFRYTGYDCVWVQNPLPPECFVYAVFDVVSLIALHEAVDHHPTIPTHFWPQTVISTLAPKALDRWLRTRAVAALSQSNERTASSSTATTNSLTLVETTVATRKDKQPIRSEAAGSSSSIHAPPPPPPSATTAGGFNDDDPQFLRDMEEALRLSRQEAEKQQGGGGGDMTSGSSKQGSPYEKGDATLLEEDFDGGEEAHFATDVYDDTHNKRDGGNPIKLGTWDSIDDYESNERRGVGGSSSNSNKSNYEQQRQQQQHPGYDYMQQISRAMNQHASGEYSFEPPPEQASWNNLAETSMSEWKRGADVELDWTEMEQRNAELANSSQPAETVKFHTSVHGQQVASWASQQQQKKSGEDNWDTADAKPTMMQMRMNPLPKFKIKQKTKGPRVIIPDDDDFSDDDDDDDDDDISTTSDESADDEIVAHVEETYKDDIFLSGQGAIHMHLIREVAQLATLPQLNSSDNPQQPLTAAITAQAHRVVTREGVPELHLKALQIYISTGDAYTVLTDHVHALTGNNREKIQSSTIGYILTSPNVRRVMWGYQFVADELQHRLGFEPGPMVDLAVCYNDNVDQDGKPVSVWDAALEFANADFQQDLNMFRDCKHDMEGLQQRKFSSSLWDKERVPEAALRYSAMQAWLLHYIYERTLERGHPPIKDYHVWQSNTKYSLEL
ncbi:hypothetical protein O0I10_002730 [Lichtheimia ornata]|uniref:3'-5' exonuclease domain-containing protein n=1 Tax=Lichtheimia ornata TaxID=688661 RepID=A0AAD7V8N5_9FUNG|nr:uncharacterized protein O0I10_002730 [Lichtheimia ornata]KAJ8661464.1 hypothetical protein O0I10_002730 [Lichtheimia ornata]